MARKSKFRRYWDTRTDEFQSRVRKAFTILKFSALTLTGIGAVYFAPLAYKEFVILPSVSREISISIYNSHNKALDLDIKILKSDGSESIVKPGTDGTYIVPYDTIQFSFDCNNSLLVYSIPHNGDLTKEYYTDCNPLD